MPSGPRPTRTTRGLLGAVLLALGASLPAITIFIAVLSIPLSAAPALGLSGPQLTAWIVAVWGLPGALGLWLAIRHRQPLVLTGNVFALILIASLAGQVSYSDLVGASMLAGLLVLLLGALGLTGRLEQLIPTPIVLGLLAGAVMPFVVGIFTALGDEPLVIGSAFVAYVGSRRFLAARIPAIFPALVAGLAAAGLAGQVGQLPPLAMPVVTVTLPTLSLSAIATVTPVLIALMTLQANLPSAIFLRSEGYDPPEREIDIVSGVGTLAGSLLGPTAVSMPLPVIPLVAGADAGERDERHRSAYVAGGALVLIGLLAGVAAGLSAIIPLPLLLALAGLSLFAVFVSTLQQIVKGSLLLGPLFAFAIAQSPLTLFGFGPFFWALVLGIGVSLLLERDELNSLRAGVARR